MLLIKQQKGSALPCLIEVAYVARDSTLVPGLKMRGLNSGEMNATHVGLVKHAQFLF